MRKPAAKNPEHHLPTDEGRESDAEAIRELLRRGEVAEMSDQGVMARIGRLIARAVFDPRKQRW